MYKSKLLLQLDINKVNVSIKLYSKNFYKQNLNLQLLSPVMDGSVQYGAAVGMFWHKTKK